MSTHSNAPLTPEGRRRLCERIDSGRPLAHVADEGGVSRTTLTKWYKRWLAHGECGLLDRTSRPDHQPTRTADDIEEMVIQLRVHEKWGPDRIAGYLPTVGAGSSDSVRLPCGASSTATELLDSATWTCRPASPSAPRTATSIRTRETSSTST